MKKFTIWVNQYNMGDFEGVDAANALDQYASDAGYRDWKEIEEVQVFEWTAEDYARGHRTAAERGRRMKYAKLARTKNEAYRAAVEDLKKYSKQAEDVGGLESSEKLDALYGVERAFKKALKAAQEQREMEQKYDKDVEWTIEEVVSLCRDMDGKCEECPLYDKQEQRCFRAKDNGIAGASTPASWNLEYSPELQGTPAGDWIEAFKASHPCECCSSFGGHCDVTGDRFPGRRNCIMTRVPGEWEVSAKRTFGER